jgi:hypothetical protein
MKLRRVEGASIALCFVLGFFVSGVSFHAFGDESTGKSIQQSEGLLKRTWKDLQLSTFGWGYGPSLQRWDGQVPNRDGSPGGNVAMTTQLSASLSGPGEMRWVVVPTVNLLPWGQQGGFQLVNPTAGLQGTIYDRNGWMYWARYEAVLPVTPASQSDGLIAGPQAVNVFAYQKPGTKLQYRLVAVPYSSFFRNGDTSHGLYLNPSINYHFNSKWMALSLLEVNYARGRTNELWDLDRPAPYNVGVGFRRTFNSNFFVQPFLNFYPDAPVMADTMHLAMFFGGTFK